jgi:exodeoxyribonuclease-5|tara:strand:+ start:121 stop:1626 length:1506 start_codon:yes stop_codon:yes gene_type:complete
MYKQLFMATDLIYFSGDQTTAYNEVVSNLKLSGIDLSEQKLLKKTSRQACLLSIIGKAGTGKTLLITKLFEALKSSGVNIITGDYESKKLRTERSLSILAPTNKAASVLRSKGVPATTLHRILYTPIYDPEYEKIAEWLLGNSARPENENFEKSILDRIFEFYKINKSIPGALASAGLKGSDFIKGWKRREEPLDVGFVDEASMLDNQQFEDLKEIFSNLILFGDPAQLAPINQSGSMIFDKIPNEKKYFLSQIHRQQNDNPILELANKLQDPSIDFFAFDQMVREASIIDERVVYSQRVNIDLMAFSPVLVWRNSTRIRLINAFREAHSITETELVPGEPLICDGIELPIKHRKKRIDLEARGLVKGAHVIYLGPGRKPGFSKLHILGSDDPQVSAASIVKIEKPDAEEPFIPFAARMGATFLHGSAVTIHKSQGSQWEQVQVISRDLAVAADTGRIESGQPLWKRLTYVAITRAQRQLNWVTRNRLSKPKIPLDTANLI